MPSGVIQRAFFVGAQKRPWSHDSGLCRLSPVFPRTCSRFPTNLFPDKEVEEKHMLDDHFHSTDAGVKYRDVTEEFKRSYPKAWKNLNAKNWQLDRNANVAILSGGTPWSEEGKRAKECGIHRRGKSRQAMMRYTHYCKQQYICVRCASLVSRYRAQQLMTASEKFAEHLGTNHLRLQTFTLKPNTFRITSDTQESFPTQVRLLSRFFDLLGNYHKERGVRWFDKTKGRSREKEVTLLGPTVGSIHVVPACESRAPYSHAHAHLGVVMTKNGQKRKLKAKLEELFAKAKNDLKLSYTPDAGEEEIVPIKRNQVFADRNNIPEQFKNASWESFDPDFLKSDTPEQQMAMKAFHYMSRPFKAKWSPEGVLEARQMLDMIGMTPSQLHRRFGMLGTVRQQLPDSPPSDPEDRTRLANYDPMLGWKLYEPVIG